MIFQLIYTCALASHVSNRDLEAIAETSRRRNLERGITGILLCKEGSVLQVLEGDRDAVLALYQKITVDNRVSNHLVLIKRLAAKREFPNWSMGYNAEDETDTVFNLCARKLSAAMPRNASDEVGTISRTFARVTGLA